MIKCGEMVKNMQFSHTSEHAYFLQKVHDLPQKGHHQISHAYFVGEIS